MGVVPGRVQLRRRLPAPERRAVHRPLPAAGGLQAAPGDCTRQNAVIGCNTLPHEYSNMSC